MLVRIRKSIPLTNGSGAAIFVTFKMATKNYFFLLSFLVYYFLKLYLHNFSKIKSHREVTKQEAKVSLTIFA
jgi:hypothetical protein